MSRILGTGPLAGEGGQMPGVAPFTGQPQQRLQADPTPALGADSVAAADNSLTARLEDEVDRLTGELERLAARGEALQQQAYDKGMSEGSRKSAEDVVARDNLLRQALDVAGAAFSGRQGQVEYLAVVLAEAALAKVLGADAATSERVARVVKHQVARFAADKPMALRLSRHDFPDAAAAAEVAAEVPDLRLVIDPAMAAGSCVLALEMGEREIGLPGQLEQIRAYFGQLALEAEQAPVARHVTRGSQQTLLQPGGDRP